jgi:hypothetical protein
MNPGLKRVLFYMVLAAALYAIATFFTVSRPAFVVIFVVGLTIGVTADLMYLAYLIRLPWRRSRQKPG